MLTRSLPPKGGARNWKNPACGPKPDPFDTAPINVPHANRHSAAAAQISHHHWNRERL
jgi:hypothetical protein